MASRWLLASVFLLACVEPDAVCERDVGAKTAPASAADRRLLGAAAEYPARPELEARMPELVASQRARREVAWDAIARVLAPTPLREPTALGASEGTGTSSVPRFRTFYDREDFARVFQHLYGGLSPEERAARVRPTPAQVDAAFLWNVGFLEELGTWPESRWQAYLDALDTPEEVHAVGGVRRITMSPGLTRHLVESYPEVLACRAEGPPPAELAGEPRVDRLLRAAVELAGCEERVVGPFFVARGGSLDARLERARLGGTASPEGGLLAMLEGATLDAASLRCEDRTGCTAQGPGQFFVRVRSEGPPVVGALEVLRTQTAAPVACLNGALPLDAVSIAAEWRRVEEALPLPVYDTSAEALATLLREPMPTWGAGARTALPDASTIYTQRLETGEVYVLAGFHIRTRELPLGLNITVWWSDRPDEDFGADRPDAIRALGGPWSNYKMCVSVEHQELDPDPQGGFGESAPSLGAVLAAVHEGRGGPTWCSNPYVDAAPGLARGNCVGCHQHAMSGVRPGEVATEEARFPSSGRLAARNNYPADGFWGLDAGDELAGLIQEVVDYWR
jgi:hypothetical protein